MEAIGTVFTFGRAARRVDAVDTNASRRIAPKKPGWKLGQITEYPSAARQRSCGASPFGAAEWVEAGTVCDGPEEWPEWKIEDDLAYQQWLDDVHEPDVD